jgi:Spy/CpxP family protein refolding chaperone
MTNKMKNWLLGATLAGAAAMSVGSWAMGHRGGMEQDPGRMLSHMTKKLDLNSEQQANTEKLLTESREANAPDRERLQQLRTEIGAQRDDFDAGTAQGIADEIGRITGRMVYRASETWARVYQLLDAEQRADLDAMMAKRDTHRDRRHKYSE